MSKQTLNGRTLVVQITGEEIRIARAVRGGAGQLQDLTVIPTPQGAVEDGELRDVDALRQAMEPVLKADPFRRCRRAALLVCSPQIISESVTVPAVRKRQRLGQMLRANMDMYFPVNPADYHLTWQIEGREKTDDGVESLRVRLWAVPLALLKSCYALFNAMGIGVSMVGYCGYAAAEAAGAAFGEPDARRAAPEDEQPESARLFVNMEAESVLLTFVQNGRVRLQRLLQRGYAYQDDLNEIAMVLDYFAAMPGRPVLTGAAVSGGRAEETDLRAGLEQLLDLPVETEEGDGGAAWVLCEGMARSPLDFGDFEMNHLTGSAQPITRPWQYGLIFLGGAALVASVLLMMTSRLTWDTQLSALRGTQNQLMLMAQQNAGSSQNYEKYADRYDAYSRDWDAVFDSVRTYNDNLVLVLEALENRLPTDATVTALSTTDRGLAAQVAFEEVEDAAYFLVSLRDAPYMSIQSISSLTIGAKEAYSPDNMLAALYGEEEEVPIPAGDGAEADEDAAGGEEEPPTEGSYSLDGLFSSAADGSLTIDGSDIRQLLPVLSAAGVDDSVIQRLTEYADKMEHFGISISPDNMGLVSSVLGSLTGGGTSSGSIFGGGSSSGGTASGGTSSSGGTAGTGSAAETAAVARLRLNLQYLSAAQLDALQAVYGPEQKNTYKLDALLRAATLSQQKEAIRTLLETDPSAMYKFFLLMQKDIARDEGERTLYDLIFDDVWENADMHRMFFESDQTLLDRYLPDLTDILTESRRNVEAAEDLIREDDGLAEKLAVHLAAAMCRIRTADTALDLNMLRSEMDSGAALNRDAATAGAVRVLLAAEQSSGPQTGVSDEELLQYLALLMAMNQNQSGGTGIGNIFGGGQAAAPADDRYFLTVVLGYDDSLIQAEQVRKGLDRTAKVEKVEVDQ